MILVFTEDEKKMIESMGLSVIEYKRFVYTLTDSLERVIPDIIDAMTEAMKVFSDTVIDVVGSISDLFDSLEIHFPDRPRYPIVRQYSKCKTPDRNLIWKPRAKARSRL